MRIRVAGKREEDKDKSKKTKNQYIVREQLERNARIEIASILGIWHALTKSSIEVCFFLVSLHQRDDYVSSGDLILLKQKKKKREKGETK